MNSQTGGWLHREKEPKAGEKNIINLNFDHKQEPGLEIRRSLMYSEHYGCGTFSKELNLFRSQLLPERGEATQHSSA